MKQKSFGKVIGAGPGRSMGLVLFLSGSGVVILGIITARIRSYRNLVSN